MTNEYELPLLPEDWETELLEWVSACQSAYHIDNTPGHRFGGLGSNLEENRSEIVCFVRGLIESQTITLHSQDREGDDLKEVGKQAVRWAPSSAYWSAELARLFGPDAREGINVLEARLRDFEVDALRWRYMRRKLCLTGNGNGTCAMYAINLPEAINGWPEPGQVAEFCEAAIDHARRIEGEGEC